MAISDYTSLRAAIALWLERSDLTDRIPEFIELLEDDLKRRLRKNTVRTSVTLDALNVAVPAAIAEVRGINLNTSPNVYNRPLTQMSVVQLYEDRTKYLNAGKPTAFAVLNGEIMLNKVPDATYTAEIFGYATFTSVVSSTALISEARDLYLYGALTHAAPYLQHDERLPVWSQKYEKVLQDMNILRERKEFSANPRPARLPVVFGG